MMFDLVVQVMYEVWQLQEAVEGGQWEEASEVPFLVGWTLFLAASPVILVLAQMSWFETA